MLNPNLFLGDEWLYYKIYCGVKIGNDILLELSYPIKEFVAQGKIAKWFFIRYQDPDDHLRIRFLIPKAQYQTEWIQKMHSILQPYVYQNIIWKVQTDTYKPEIQRYGEKTIELSETLFWIDSEMISGSITILFSNSNPLFTILFALKSIDSFLNDFELTINEKYELLNLLQLKFKNEFHADKRFKKQLDKSFRELTPAFKAIVEENTFPDQEGLLETILKLKSNKIKTIIPKIKQSLEISIFDFLASHVHMMLNRQFTSKQRHHELVIYDHLFRYYKIKNKRLQVPKDL